jgi:hypothetical protein
MEVPVLATSSESEPIFRRYNPDKSAANIGPHLVEKTVGRGIPAFLMQNFVFRNLKLFNFPTVLTV